MIIETIKLRINKHILIFIVAFLTVFGFSGIRAQEINTGTDARYDSLVQTILLHKQGWELSMPVINQAKSEKLELRFDYLEELDEELSYSIVSCTYDWQINQVNELDYIEGFNDVSMYDYESSRNTTKYYTHYKATFPNADISLLQSGNYLLKVHNAAQPEQVLFTRRFAASEDMVEIEARVNRPDFTHQELMLQVNLESINVQNPREDIKVVIQKNYDWENRVIIKKPPMLRDNILFFDLPFQIMTTGDNEYRDVDLKDVKYVAPRVDSIRYIPPFYHYYLTPDKPTPYDPYLHSSDLNGKHYIDLVGAYNRHTEADYVYVHFTFETIQALGADVYIYGALTNWETDTNNYMVYDTDNGTYTATLFLKQGMINYLYATREYNKEEVMFDITEGSHDETENDYHIFVYWSDFMSDFDRLVGYTVVNTKNN